MAAALPTRQRLALAGGSLSLALDESVTDELNLTDGSEVEIRVEQGRIVIEPVQPKLLGPASDVAARAERRQRIAESMRYVMDKHDDAFALLAK